MCSTVSKVWIWDHSCSSNASGKRSIHHQPKPGVRGFSRVREAGAADPHTTPAASPRTPSRAGANPGVRGASRVLAPLNHRASLQPRPHTPKTESAAVSALGRCPCGQPVPALPMGAHAALRAPYRLSPQPSALAPAASALTGTRAFRRSPPRVSVSSRRMEDARLPASGPINADIKPPIYAKFTPS
jgi:hypothetical protein